MKYSSQTIGKCLTERKLENFEQESLKCVLYFTVSQDRNVDGFSLKRIEELNIRTHMTRPRCGNGQKLYGVYQDGTIVMLMQIVDSSD